MAPFLLPKSDAGWLDRCYEGIQRLEFEEPATWWFVQNWGDRYYMFEPELWAFEMWLGGSHPWTGVATTKGGQRYGMVTELQLWEWLRRHGRHGGEGVMGILDFGRQRIFRASLLAYYDHLTRKHQYFVRDQRIKLRMARRIA